MRQAARMYVLSNTELSGSHRFVMLALIETGHWSYSHGTYTLNASLNSICEFCNMPDQYITRIMSDLREKGEIEYLDSYLSFKRVKLKNFSFIRCRDLNQIVERELADNIVLHRTLIDFNLGIYHGHMEEGVIYHNLRYARRELGQCHKAGLRESDHGCLYLDIEFHYKQYWHTKNIKILTISEFDEIKRLIGKRHAKDPDFIPIRFDHVFKKYLPLLNLTHSIEYCTSKHHTRGEYMDVASSAFTWEIAPYDEPICEKCATTVKKLEEEHRRREEEIKQTTEYQRSLMTPKLRKRILLRDQYTCQNPSCNSIDTSGRTLEVDHIVPISRGGKTQDANLQVLCATCNRDKFTKTNKEWLKGG